MQPNNQQGYYRPDQNQPVAPEPPVSQQPPIVQQSVQPPVAEQVAPEQPVDASTNADDTQGYEDAPVTWTAKEYINQEKGTMWFTIFAVVTVGFLGLAIFLQQWSFAVLIVVIALVIIISSKRPPRELTYSLTNDGLMVDDKLHTFSSFKSFGIIRDGEEFSVMLIPTQRFQPGVTVYFPEEAGEDIVDILGSRLPMKDLKLDAVDRLVRLLRL